MVNDDEVLLAGTEDGGDADKHPLDDINPMAEL
jgi:hypothetical protein